MNLSLIEHLTKNYSLAHRDLAALITKLEAQIEDFRQKALPGLKKAICHAALQKSTLQNAIEDYPRLFEKPRTHIFHDIKVGLQKGKGGIDWDDDAQVCALIRQKFPRPQADLLIKTIEKPIAAALEDLDAKDLKSIGCRLTDTGDHVVIKPTDSNADKLIAALLKDALAETPAPTPAA